MGHEPCTLIAIWAFVYPEMLLKRIAGLYSPSVVSAQAAARELRLEFDRIGNARELPLLLRHGKEFTEVLVSPA